MGLATVETTENIAIRGNSGSFIDGLSAVVAILAPLVVSLGSSSAMKALAHGYSSLLDAIFACFMFFFFPTLPEEPKKWPLPAPSPQARGKGLAENTERGSRHMRELLARADQRMFHDSR